MRTVLIIKINPGFSGTQECSKAVIAVPFSHSELKHANKTLCITIVGGRARPAHREYKAFLQEQMAGLLSSELFPLVAVPDAARFLKGDGLDRVRHQICPHMVVKSHPPKSYEGCGKLKQTRSIKIKGQKEAATEEYYVYGWKVLVLIEVQTRLPLAMKLVKIQDYEGSWLIPLLEQAQRNLGEHAQIGTVVIDRGYLDGDDLWRVHQRGILFVIVGQANMAVTQDAQGLAKGERAVVREGVVGHGHGTKATQERLRTEVVGLSALTSYDSYGESEHTKSAHRRDYQGQPINAVVVRRWENRVPKGGGTVYLTNGDVGDPFSMFDTYDWRSVIENGIFKEGKHPWHLLRFPKRTQAAVVVHSFFTLLVMGLCTAFRLWQARSASTPTTATEILPTLSSALLGGEGTARWSQRLREENRDKIIVFLGRAYGIFYLAEFAILTHVPLRRLPAALGSPQAVLQRFCLSP